MERWIRWFGVAVVLVAGCGGDPERDADGDRVLAPTDCDDLNGNVFPGALETCNGIDDDCDGEVDEESATDAAIWYIDGDGDGVGDLAVTACERPDDAVELGGDCDDADPTTFPGSLEQCDEVDNDCDGAVDEEVLDLPTWYADADEDTFGNPEVASVGCQAPDAFVAVGTDCDDNDAAIYPGAAEYCADAIDNDCDGSVDEADAVDAPIWYADTDRDGFGDPATAVRACTAPTGHVADATDCDDTSDAIFPGAPEVCDTIDNDCDTAIDEEGAIGTVRWFRDGDGDGYGTPDTSVLECSAPAGYVADDTDCNDNDRDLSPATPWHYDSDGDGFGVTATTVVQCASPGSDYSRTDGDCQPNDPDSYPGAPERCVEGAVAEAIDNDCDGNVDETCPEIHCGTVTADETWGANANGHLVTCNVVVQGVNAPILTIDAGASVAFSAEAALWVGISAPGDLVVQGTDTLPVTMTSDASTPAPGDWGGIVLQDDTSGITRLDYTTIEYAGGSDTYPAALDIRNASPALDHVTIRESQRNGLRVRDGRPLVTDSEIVDNTEYGILCQEGTCLDDAPDSFDGNVLTGNEVPLRLRAEEVRAIGPANTFSGNFADRVEVRGGTVDRTATWRDIGVAYRVTQTVSVADRTAAPVLTLGGGAEIEFDQGTGLRVGQSGPGDLATDGTATVILRSGRASPLPGDWEGVTLGSLVSSATVLDDIEIAHGEDNLLIEPDGVATIDRAYFHHAQDDGIDAGNRVSLTLTNAELAFNGGFGARLADSVVVQGTVTGLDAHDNDQPLQIPSGHVHRLAPGSSFDGNTLDRIVVRHQANLDADVTWEAQDARYYVEESVYVGDIATRPALTIADGARVTFGAGQGIYVGLFSKPGDLVVDGDPIAGSGVTFGSEAEAGPGTWVGLVLNRPSSDSRLRGFTLRDAGSSTGYPGGLHIIGGDVDVSDCVVDDNLRWGIYASGTSGNPLDLSVSRCSLTDTVAGTVGDETGSGLFVSDDPNALVTVDDVTATGNDYAPVQLHANAVSGLEGATGGSNWGGNGVDWIHIHGGTIRAGTHVWADLGVPYYLARSVFVAGPAGPLLTTTGTTLLVGPGRSLEIGASSAGDLFADGVMFTSAREVPLPGDWRGILLGGQTTFRTEIKGSTIEYGGALNYSVNANLQIRDSDVTITDTMLSDSSGSGVRCTNGAIPALNNLSFDANAALDIDDCS